MKEIAQLIRRSKSKVDEPEAPVRSLRLNPKKLARSAYKKSDLDDQDFLAGDVSDFESEQYEDSTGLEDDGRLDVEGTGDARKKMLLKAIAKARTK